MAQYRDTAGQIHTLRITLAHRRPIIDATEWDLLELAHKPERLDAFLKALAEDDDLIWALLGQIEGGAPEELMAMADGTTHEDASAALLEALQLGPEQLARLRAVVLLQGEPPASAPNGLPCLSWQQLLEHGAAAPAPAWPPAARSTRPG